MKYPKMTQQIELLLLEKTKSGEEVRVFIAWQSDSLQYQTTASIIASRTGMGRQNVYRALKGLVDKNILKVSGFKRNVTGRESKVYELTKSFKYEANENHKKRSEVKYSNMDLCYEDESAEYEPIKVKTIDPDSKCFKKAPRSVLSDVVPDKKFDQDVLDMFDLKLEDMV